MLVHTALGEVLTGLRPAAKELRLGPLGTDEAAALATRVADAAAYPDAARECLSHDRRQGISSASEHQSPMPRLMLTAS